MTDTQPIHACHVDMKVPFHDADPMQVVWHGNYVKYFEIARDELFTRNGINLVEYGHSTQILFPIVKLSVKYVMPIRFAMDFACYAELKDASRKIVIDFEIRVPGEARVFTQGRTEQIAVKYPEMESLLAIPEDIRKKLGF